MDHRDHIKSTDGQRMGPRVNQKVLRSAGNAFLLGHPNRFDGRAQRVGSGTNFDETERLLIKRDQIDFTSAKSIICAKNTIAL